MLLCYRTNILAQNDHISHKMRHHQTTNWLQPPLPNQTEWATAIGETKEDPLAFLHDTLVLCMPPPPLFGGWTYIW